MRVTGWRPRSRARGTDTDLLGADGIVVLEDLGLAYVAIPKCANSTVKAVCAHLLADRLGDLYDPRWPPAPFRSPERRHQLHDLDLLGYR